MIANCKFEEFRRHELAVRHEQIPLSYRFVAVMRLHLQIVPAPTVRLSRLGYDAALMGALAIAMRGLE